MQIKQITAKAADVLDLAIEFSTLGEYGLEYPESEGTAPCRPGRPRKKPAPGKRLQPRTRAPRPARPQHKRPTTCPTTQATRLPEALMPPRIKLDLSY
ncbi:MAG: hypothetical protein IPK93_10915 [Solirubrobacterales bacterium]|nr:hypothetical protein [Solirubrobacterales bacterium]